MRTAFQPDSATRQKSGGGTSQQFLFEPEYPAEEDFALMLRRFFIFALATLIVSSLVFLACSQVDPTVSPFTKTTLTLTPQRFPAPPADMSYALWGQKRDGTSKFIGRFTYDDSLEVFLTENGVLRNNVFQADFNLLDYDYISVSIERNASFSTTTPGPIFLRDTVRSPEIREILRMRFPADFSRATGRVSMATASDGDNNPFNRTMGLWFCAYTSRNRVLTDTLNAVVRAQSIFQRVRNLTTDSTLGTTLDTIGVESVDTVILHQYSNFRLDTFTVASVQPVFKIVPINTTTDSINYVFGDAGHSSDVMYAPDRDYVFDLTKALGPPRNAVENIFTPSWDFLPSLRNTGWHYKGWVASGIVGKVSGPASFYPMNIGYNIEMNWQKQGRFLFATGIFYDTVIDSSQILGYDTTIFYRDTFVDTVRSYKYEAGYHVSGTEPHPHLSASLDAYPPFAGEEFLSVLDPVDPDFPDPYDFTVGSFTDTALAFISVEPENFSDTTRNFPLIAFAAELSPNPANTRDTLINQTGTIFPFASGRKGWPVIEIRLKLE